jgi:flagellar basal body-associated protein FliL
MAEDEATSSVAVAERPEIALPPAPVEAKAGKNKKSRKNNDQSIDDDLEREIEFSTPFGKIEFELEPTSGKQKREERRREKERADAEKAAAQAAKKAARQLEKHGEAAVEATRKGGGMLLPVLIVLGLIVAAVIVAFWLFARPGSETEEVPEQYRNPELEPVEEAPQDFVTTARQRIGQAIRAGKQASREAQQEQERRYQDLTRGG